jgi:hypothetical protein
MYPKSESSSG